MMKNIYILLFVLIAITASCRKQSSSNIIENNINDTCMQEQPMAYEFLNSIIDSCYLYWQDDSIVTILTFMSDSNNLNLYVGYSYKLPFVSQDFKDYAIQSGIKDAEKFKTIDDYWGYWSSINNGKTNFVVVNGDNKDKLPRSLLNIDKLQDIHSLHYSDKKTIYHGGGHVKQYKIMHRDKDSILSKSTPIQEILFQKISPDIVFD